MAARSPARRREEESGSTDEEERLLTKRCTGWHRAKTWETLCEREKAKNRNTITGPDGDVFFFLETNLSHIPS